MAEPFGGRMVVAEWPRYVGDSEGDRAMLAPREERFPGWLYAPEPGPVERFVPAFPPLYKLAEGTGRNVGVDGRDEGVGMELAVLVVAFVLMLLRPSVEVDSLDCGRRMPVAITL